MKRIYTLSLALLAITLLLNSCGSLTVTKRHYNKGYYVSYNKIKKSADTPVPQDDIVWSEVVSSNGEAIPEENNYSASVNENVEIEKLSSDDNITAAQSEETPLISKTKSPLIEKSSVIQQIPTTKKEFKQMRADYKKDKASTSSPEPASDDLSMFWIVLLIILLLWALGFGFGLGSLVHLLLVVLLILLILWLLGIV